MWLSDSRPWSSVVNPARSPVRGGRLFNVPGDSNDARHAIDGTFAARRFRFRAGGTGRSQGIDCNHASCVDSRNERRPGRYRHRRSHKWTGCQLSMSARREPVRDSAGYPATAKRFRLRTFLWLAVLIGTAAALRLSCIGGEAWFDEVWTWDICHKLTWPGGVFYQLRSENNHYLNTLVVWLLRDQPWLYSRVPAMCCGLATVGIAWKLGRAHRKVGVRAGWLAAVLTAASYLMVHYSSEARGYAYAVFFAALAYQQLQVLESCQSIPGACATIPRIRRVSSWLFPAACCGGFLSQPIFLGCFGAMAIWAFLRLERLRPAEETLPTLLKYFLPPALFFVLLYLVDLRNVVNVGGDEYPLWRVVIETLSLTGGGPFGGWGAVVVAVLVATAFVHGLQVLARDNDDRWIFHLLVVVVMPLGLILLLRRTQIYPRYFLIAVFFLIQAVSIGLADLFRRGPAFRALVMISLAAAMWGNGRHITQLAELGRGGYLPVLESIPSGEPSEVIRLRSDSDIRQKLMFKYYLPLANLRGKTFRYVTREEVPAGGTEWLLTHRLDVQWQPPGTCTVREAVYESVAVPAVSRAFWLGAGVVSTPADGCRCAASRRDCRHRLLGGRHYERPPLTA